jgi:Methyltransferase domain
MGLFKNPEASHEHSRQVLDLLYNYDDFLDGLTVIADMGCGAGYDVRWWATLETRDDNPEPHNYIVYAVDQNIKQIEPTILNLSNVVAMEGDFEKPVVPRAIDLLWAHDSFQYAKNPFECLATWKRSMSINGMLVLSIPQTTYFDSAKGKLVISSREQQYYSYNVLNLIYMLATSGFDCKDAYFFRQPQSPWLFAAVYATEHHPTTESVSWYTLAERQLIDDNIINSLNKWGYARLEDAVFKWLDKNYYQISN